MSARRNRLSLAPPELALVPLLDMISLLIQVMLFNVQFGEYGALASEVATASTGAAAGEPSFVVGATVDGFDVSLDDGTERHLACRGAGCTEPEAWDVDGLRTLLAGRHVDAKAPPLDVALVPHAGVPFDVVVRTMDALGARVGGAPPLARVALLGGGP
jgi:hypothetical protein